VRKSRGRLAGPIVHWLTRQRSARLVGIFSKRQEAYLALKEALGFPLGVRERMLRDFVAFAEINRIRGTINAQVAFDWACSVSGPLRDQWKSGAFERCKTISLSSQPGRPRH